LLLHCRASAALLLLRGAGRLYLSNVYAVLRAGCALYRTLATTSCAAVTRKSSKADRRITWKMVA